MKQFKIIDIVIGWLLFAIATSIYVITGEPTASFWDCGEYIATSYKILVGHPPGAPFFQLIGRFASLFAFGDVTLVARTINTWSAIASGLTIMFLFWTIVALAKKIFIKDNNTISTGQMIAIFGSGIIGALAYTFTDSFWFSAVEGEVYATSSFFTAVTFWAILKWEQVADQPHSERWLLLIAYLIGVSIGVHLLNLLAIPAITFVYYFKKYKTTLKGFIITGILAIIILGTIQNIIIPQVVDLFARFELVSVNILGLPFNSGTIIFALILIGFIVFGILYTHNNKKIYKNILIGLLSVFVIFFLLFAGIEGYKMSRIILGLILTTLITIGVIYTYKKNKYILNTIILAFAFLLIGYSSFLTLVIRSNANVPIDENNPENAISLLSYLNREQYGTYPLLYGQYWNSPLDPEKPYLDDEPVYTKDEKKGKYVISDPRKESILNYDSRFCTIFPRMWSSQPSHVAAYKNWSNYKGTPMIYTAPDGSKETIYKPTFGENLAFFFKYQLGWMYWRYFMWNFAGRQNDIQGHGNINEGNWISGIKFIDELRLGKQSNFPKSYINKGTNKYYMLPFLLGLIGLIYHYVRNKKDMFVVLMLFIMTGIAIVVYLNQYPYQPRERDYAYAASFYAYAIWLGLGVLAVYELFKKMINEKISAILSIILTLSVPTILAKENWDDHDRSGRRTALDFAKNYLDSCAPNAILFTNGDNDTFPLWYAQEVEGYRTDVRVCNLSLLQTDWYIDQMKRKAYNSDPIPFSMTKDKYIQGTRDIVYFIKDEKLGDKYIDLKKVMEFVISDDPRTKYKVGGDRNIAYFPTNRFSIPVDSAKVVSNGTVPKEKAKDIVKSIEWTMKGRYVLKNHLMILDLLANFNWDRPIYFAITTGNDAYIGLEDYFQLEGLAYRLVPIKNTSTDGQIGIVNTDIMYDNLMNKFKWGNMSDPNVYLDETNMRMIINFRNNFFRLADALAKEGKKDKAKQVLDRCLELMPDNVIPYNYYMLPIAELYYRLGYHEIANSISKRLFEIYDEELTYYFDLSPRHAIYIETEKQRALSVLQRLVQITKTYKQEELNKQFEAKFNYYYQKYVPLGGPTINEIDTEEGEYE